MLDACTPVGNGQHCLVGKAFTDGLLEQLVCLLVHACCGLINTQDLEHVEGVGRKREKRVSLGSCQALAPTSWLAWPSPAHGSPLPALKGKLGPLRPFPSPLLHP